MRYRGSPFFDRWTGGKPVNVVMQGGPFDGEIRAVDANSPQVAIVITKDLYPGESLDPIRTVISSVVHYREVPGLWIDEMPVYEFFTPPPPAQPSFEHESEWKPVL